MDTTAVNTAYTQQIIDNLHDISGQRYYPPVSDYDHAYAKPWFWRQTYHRVRPARFIFLKNFPRHFRSRLPPYSRSSDPNALIDVGSPTHLDHSARVSSAIDELISSQESPETQTPEQDQQQPASQPSLQTRTLQMERVYLKTCQILQNEYLSRLAHEGDPREFVYRQNNIENTAVQLRSVFSRHSNWDTKLLTWLHNTICSPNSSHNHIIDIYHEVMQVLRIKLPGLIDKFYTPRKSNDPSGASTTKTQNLPKLGRPSLSASQTQTPSTSTPQQQIPQLNLNQSHSLIDPIGNLLAIHKPHRLPSSPLFIVVPNGPNVSGQPTQTRLKFWNLLLGSIGKVVNVNLHYKPHQTAREAVSAIKLAVRDKIRESRKKFNETKAMVLVGFGHSSIIAAHCALESQGQISAIVCLGFPLFTLNGTRGDLDDPLLDLTTPILFVIGQQATLTNMDEMERFREMMTRNESSLVIAGGANDILVVTHVKKMNDGITQSMVDRCIADEIFDFLGKVLHSSKETPKPYMEAGY